VRCHDGERRIDQAALFYESRWIATYCKTRGLPKTRLQVVLPGARGEEAQPKSGQFL